MDCVFCFKQILLDPVVRTLSPKTGNLHPQIHRVPDGVDILNRPVPNACSKLHSEMEHIHEQCVPAWCDKFNMPYPEPFEPGDWERLKREVN